MRRFGLVLALLVLPSQVSAGPEQPGGGPQPHYVGGDQAVVQTILCDTVDQLESILQAQVDEGLAAGQRAYMELRSTMNEVQEPACLAGVYRLTLLDIAAQWDNVPTLHGPPATVYILYVLINDRPYAILSPVPVGPNHLEV